jgi:hypothetical protein
MGGISSPPQNITALTRVMSRQPKANAIRTTSITNTKSITNRTITHADKVMQALAECIKTITGATEGTTAQEVKDLQCIVKATQAILHKSEAPSNNSNAEQQAPRVPDIPRVHALPRVPPATAYNQQITRAMSKIINKAISTLTTMPTSVPNPDTTSKPTIAPTTSAKQDRL